MTGPALPAPRRTRHASHHVPRAERHRGLSTATITARGEPMLWLTGGSLVVCIAMIAGLLGWIAYNGMATFWPQPVLRVTTVDGRSFMGEVTRTEEHQLSEQSVRGLPDAVRAAAEARIAEGDGTLSRRLLRTGNFRLFGTHFEWVADFEAAEEELPEWAVVVERLEWGRFYGFPQSYAYLTPVLPDLDPEQWTREAALADARRILAATAPEPGAVLAVEVERRVDGRATEQLVAIDDVEPRDRVLAVAQVWHGAGEAWARFHARHAAVVAQRAKADHLREHEIGAVNDRLEAARLRLREAELEHAPSPAWISAYGELRAARRAADEAAVERAQHRFDVIEQDLGKPEPAFLEVVAEVEASERDAERLFADITAQIEAIEREARRDVLQFATVRDGYDAVLPLADIVRAYPANQLGFFDRIGVYVDRWWEYLTADPREANNEGGIFPAIFGTVLMTLLMCLAVVPFGVLAALYLREYAKAGPIITTVRIAVNNLAGVPSIVFGVFGLGFFCYIVGATIDDLLFAARLPQPTFGKSGLLWASLTLSLMTAPVVIVATEEALSAVPNSMREGSYACGASKWQTIRRIVLPRALPGIMTGAILAMARGAGEVAPLMLVGAVKLAPELPFDTAPPFGANRSFMHLGFHIYDLGFQSQNSEAAKPMVYTTALLLILLVALLNLTAIKLRSRLRRRFVSSAF